MTTRISLALNLGLATVLAFALLGPAPATGAGSKTLNYAAPAFEAVAESEHNDGGGDDACAMPVTSQQGSENNGDLDAIEGSYLQEVLLPQGAEVKRVTLFVNDNSDQDVHVFLVRKRVEGGLEPQSAGYKVMAQVKSADAATNVMRKFSDGSIQGKVVDNGAFYYFLEMVVCDAIEPFAVRVVYAT